PLALVRTGDPIVLDVPARRLDIDLPQRELSLRTPVTTGFAEPARGWQRLYIDHVLQADQGADLDFLVGSSGHEVSRESH
ncbi:dihydroxy-acid dehydratase, partial [Nonomuraea dietziae]